MEYKLKITKIGGSNYILVPAEFVKVFNLNKHIYNFEIGEDNNSLIYRQVSVDEELIDEAEINQEIKEE